MDQQQIEETGTETTPQAPPHEVKIERGFSRSFMIKLSDSDIAVRAREVSHLMRTIESKEEARDRAKKQANNEIEEMRATMKRLADEVHDGEERRDIPCERHFVYRTGLVQVIRTDTRDVVEERAMNLAERQPELPGMNGSGGGSEDEDDAGVDEDADDSDDEESEDEETGPAPDPEPELTTSKGRRSKR